jgi:hypothetical protein
MKLILYLTLLSIFTYSCNNSRHLIGTSWLADNDLYDTTDCAKPQLLDRNPLLTFGKDSLKQESLYYKDLPPNLFKIKYGLNKITIYTKKSKAVLTIIKESPKKSLKLEMDVQNGQTTKNKDLLYLLYYHN